METRKLGNSDLDITRIGLGAWAMGGGDWEYAWGDQSNKDSIDTIHRALDIGINWIDTAPVYGLGVSESVVGEAIAGMSEKPYIFTKCSLVWGDNRKVTSSLKADSLRKEVDDSLRRLGVDVIDLYQIHWPNPDNEIEEGWETLAEIQKAGKVRYIAVSNFSIEQMQRCQAIAPVTSNQPPYSIINHSIQNEILPFTQKENIGSIVYSPMQSGLLTGKMTRERIENLPDNDWRKRDQQFRDPNLTRNLELVETLKTIADKHGNTIPEVAIAWTLLNPAVTGAIVGARRPAQVDGFKNACDLTLDADDIAKIQAYIG